MKNQPYIKNFENGIMITKENPLVSKFPNRRQRRQSIQKSRFLGNGLNFPVFITKDHSTGFEWKFYKRIQVLQSGKQLLHTISAK